MNYRLMRTINAVQGMFFSLFSGRFMGPPTLRMTTTGRRSGRPRRSLLLYMEDGERLIIIASAGALPRDPDWCLNLRANPRVTVERAGQPAREYLAAELEGEERDSMFKTMSDFYPPFADYQSRVSRRIPVIALRPAR